MSFFNELKRRNVFRVGFAYAVVGWLVAQVADLALENFGAPGWVMKTVLFFMLLGFILSLFIAWAYELTPDGIKRAEDVDPDQSVTHATGRKLDRLVIVVLLMAIGLLLFDRFRSDSPATLPTPEVAATKETPIPASQNPASAVNEEKSPHSAVAATDEPSVAVLPFVNMSSDPEQEYFSDGISEEILNVLTRIPNLKVAARTSSFQFKGKNLDVAEIAKQLRVNHVLEGSVRKSGTTLRITTQLIEAETGFHVWSETFDRKLEDVFAIQDEIAAAIATELETRLTAEQTTASVAIDMEAYGLYLKARTLVAARSEFKLLEAIDLLTASIDIAPKYAPAMAILAKAYAVLPWFSDKLPVGEARELARQWASRALDKDSNNAEALSALAIVLSESDMNWTGARDLLDRAINANPGSVAANNFRGDLATRTGDLENALKYELRAAELDPLGPVQLTDLANVYALNGDYQEVIRLANRALGLDQNFFSSYTHLMNANFALGDLDQLENISRKLESMPETPPDLTAALSLLLSIGKGKEQQAQAYLQRRAQLARSGEVWASSVAFDATSIGDFDLAGEMLLQAYREKDGTWSYPIYIRLPEQAPDSEAWQEFWRQPGVAELAELRRSHGLNPNAPTFGSGAKP